MIMPKGIPTKKFLFVDTNIFIDAVTCDSSKQILDELIRRLEQKKITLILPEVIEMEIITQYSFWKKDVLKKAEENLSTESILGIKDVTDKSAKRDRKGETEAKKINSIIAGDRKKLLDKIKTHYESVSKDINKIFKHKNTARINLTNLLVLEGMKRSLLKRAPYTRTDKATENAHTKDIDCIAFESLRSFLRSQKTKSDLIMCVSDKDYISENGELHYDICEDLNKCKLTSYQNLSEMIAVESRSFKAILRQKTRKNTESGKPTLASAATGLDHSRAVGSGIVAGYKN